MSAPSHCLFFSEALMAASSGEREALLSSQVSESSEKVRYLEKQLDEARALAGKQARSTAASTAAGRSPTSRARCTSRAGANSRMPRRNQKTRSSCLLFCHGGLSKYWRC